MSSISGIGPSGAIPLEPFQKPAPIKHLSEVIDFLENDFLPKLSALSHEPPLKGEK
ncbi:MAG: hypothetical protein KDK60_00265 [Chlamydiia bacterium]|nr:hypothetical protein [Chlamydiia bacterium]